MEEKKKKKKKEIKELGIDLIQGKSRSNSKEIAWNLFIKNHNQVSMFVQTNPEEYKKNINENEKQKIERKKEKGNKIQTSPKRLNTNSINSCFKMWIGCKDFLDEIRSFSTKFKCMKKTYQFNLNPFFEYLKIKEIKLTHQEKNILIFLFNPNPVRKELYKEFKEYDFLTAIPTFYIKYLHLPFLRKEFTNIPRHFEFKEEFLNAIINPEYKKHRYKNNKSIYKVKQKFTKQEMLWENNMEKINFYSGNTIISKKINNKWQMVEYDREIYVFYYSLFHKYFKVIIEGLDNTMGKLLGLY